MEKDNNSVKEDKQNNGLSQDSRPFFCENENNKNLTPNISTLSDLKIYLKLKFLSYREAGQTAGISECRVRQILIGYDLPKTPKLIDQIADGWDINPIKLTQLFERERQEKNG